MNELATDLLILNNNPKVPLNELITGKKKLVPSDTLQYDGGMLVGNPVWGSVKSKLLYRFTPKYNGSVRLKISGVYDTDAVSAYSSTDFRVWILNAAKALPYEYYVAPVSTIFDKAIYTGFDTYNENSSSVVKYILQLGAGGKNITQTCNVTLPVTANQPLLFIQYLPGWARKCDITEIKIFYDEVNV